jgi:hypothetical protein
MSAKILQYYNKSKESPILQGSKLPLVTASLLRTKEKRMKNSIETNLESGQETLEAERYRPQQAQANLSARALLKIAETKEAINVWMSETQKDNSSNGQCEMRSVDVIESALATVDAAEEAILDAAVARIDEDRLGPCLTCLAIREGLF